MKISTIYTIGHGNKSIDVFLEEIDFFNINYLIDIRSRPYSKYNSQYNKGIFEITLTENDVKYVYLGDILGGLPEDKTCYTNDHVDYTKLANNKSFKLGLNRLIVANQKQIKIAIMCSESKPEECHRSKLIGEELRKHGIIINHITRSKDKLKRLIVKDQLSVMHEVAPDGTTNLFGDELSFKSRKPYKLD